MSDLPDPLGDNYSPAGPARGAGVSPSSDFKGPLAHLAADGPSTPPNDHPPDEDAPRVYSALVSQGYSPEDAARMSGYMPVEVQLQRPNVHVYEPPEDLGPTRMDSWTDAQRQRLVKHLTRIIGQAGDAGAAAEVVARMFENGVAMGVQDDPFESGSQDRHTSPVVCEVCGAMVADLDKHLSYAHPEETS